MPNAPRACDRCGEPATARICVVEAMAEDGVTHIPGQLLNICGPELFPAVAVYLFDRRARQVDITYYPNTARLDAAGNLVVGVQER